MALYTGYFDESGHESADLLLLGGLVIDVENIREFDAAWLTAIAPLPALHMKDLVTGNAEYFVWKGRYEEKAAIVSAVAEVISRFSHQTFSAALWMEDYVRANLELKISEAAGHPFAVCARLADVQLNQWARRHKVTDRIKIVFEKRPSGMGETVDSFQRDELPVPAWEGKEVCALQAADYIAWMRNGKIRKSKNYERFAGSEPSSVLHTHDWFGYNDIMDIAGRIAEINSRPIPLRSDDTQVVYHDKPKRVRVPFRRAL
jgi:hypothetical protein